MNNGSKKNYPIVRCKCVCIYMPIWAVWQLMWNNIYFKYNVMSPPELLNCIWHCISVHKSLFIFDFVWSIVIIFRLGNNLIFRLRDFITVLSQIFWKFIIATVIIIAKNFIKFQLNSFLSQWFSLIHIVRL